MKLLLIHNRYIHSGGEDSVFDEEVALLKENGHEVITYTRDNQEIKDFNIFQKAMFPLKAIYNKEIKEIIRKHDPDIIHIHNFFPLISPAVFYSKKPTIQTLHNYRHLCAGALFLRKNKVCELCKKNSFNAIRFKCYRNSRFLSALVVFMNKLHRKHLQKQHFIVMTEFMKQKFYEYGFMNVYIKPNFVGPSKKMKKENLVAYVGRLSEEKGIKLLSKAWQEIDYQLKIYGDGPLSNEIKNEGRHNHNECMELIAKSKFVIVPSICYECFPRTIVEAFSVGTPVLASNLGNMKHIIKNNETGLLFNPGNPEDLKNKAQYLIDNPKECERLGKNAYREYKTKYTPEKNYERLMEIYEKIQLKQL